jgi:hypothetical protein
VILHLSIIKVNFFFFVLSTTQCANGSSLQAFPPTKSGYYRLSYRTPYRFTVRNLVFSPEIALVDELNHGYVLSFIPYPFPFFIVDSSFYLSSITHTPPSIHSSALTLSSSSSSSVRIAICTNHSCCSLTGTPIASCTTVPPCIRSMWREESWIS